MEDITANSKAIEKGLELAKDFLTKIIGPSAEEIGLLMSDNIRFFRFKNQVKILTKAQEYIVRKNISLQQIPVKVLVPLLENASLEENEELQVKWSNMICNMVDAETNLVNHVFPYILGQISIEEFLALEKLNNAENEHWAQWKRLHEIENSGEGLSLTDRKIKEKLKSNDEEGFIVFLDEFEMANLIRLGLVEKVPPRIKVEGFGLDSLEETPSFDAEYESYSSYHRITELGSKLIMICSIDK
ncbi:DUF4393 domain-containing protein [Carboxylicivirga sp. A043]|uniref:DUF4393 domain-containing protein n=1 Tax=Carboxylicivirga litoralis TaxID=2816963 RepID=UPI0021CB3683|nr:DUF4393 domain-containing protein [Carboxylicivirga sp. A043]MCU4156588.1 DUF4393 domain-containing protein [Carboxylicivirga sp. A043]